MTVAIPLWKPRRGIRSGPCSGALLSASLALFLPAAASAASLTGATYDISISLTKNSSATVTPDPISSSDGTNLSASDSFKNSGSTTNNYSVPSLSANAASGACPFLGTCAANVFDQLTYYVEFSTTTGSSLSIPVGVKSSTSLFSSNGDLAGYNAEVEIGIAGTLLFLSGNQSFNSSISFTENVPYQVFMQVVLNPSGVDSSGNGTTASGSADPHFTPPLFDSAGNAITFEIFDGIGNNSPVGATPIPAALPLFATGIGALGLLGRRRKRKAKAVWQS